MTPSARIPVLMYHRVGDARNDWEARYAISPQGFAAHVAALQRGGFRAVTIDALVDWLGGGPALAQGSIVITFDDGFRGVREHALPVLQRAGWPFAVFLVSDLIGQQDVWTRSENPDGVTHPLLDHADIDEMQRAGVSFHSHTRRHASLPTLGDPELVDELQGSRERLSAILGRDVPYLAYPFGHLDERVEAATRAAGYRAAFSTQPGFNRQNVNRFRIRRLDVSGTDTPAMLLRKVRFGSNDGSLANAARYYVGQAGRRMRGLRR